MKSPRGYQRKPKPTQLPRASARAKVVASPNARFNRLGPTKVKLSAKVGPAQYGGASPSKDGPVMVGDYRRAAIKKALGGIKDQVPPVRAARPAATYSQPKPLPYGRKKIQFKRYQRRARSALR